MLYMDLFIPNYIKYSTELLYFAQLSSKWMCAIAFTESVAACPAYQSPTWSNSRGIHAPELHPIALWQPPTRSTQTIHLSLKMRRFSTILMTGEWTHLRPHACYRLKWGTKRSARRCSIRWYQRRPSYSTMATNARRSILNLSRNLSRNFLSLKSQLLHNS